VAKKEDIFKDSLDKVKLPERERFWKTLAWSFIPDKYRTLSSRPLSSSLAYFLRIILLSFGILVVLLLFNVATLSRSLNEEFSRFESLKVTVDFKLKEPISLERYGIIIADQKAYDGENLLVTLNGSTRKPAVCVFLEPACWFGNRTMQMNNSIDLAADSGKSSRSAMMLVILLLPSLLALYLIYSGLMLSLLVLVATALGFFISRLTGGRASLMKTFLVALHASTIVALLEPFNLVLWKIYSVHLILFVGLFTICMLLVAEKRHRYEDE
jgi:hypothetical protein